MTRKQHAIILGAVLGSGLLSSFLTAFLMEDDSPGALSTVAASGEGADLGPVNGRLDALERRLDALELDGSREVDAPPPTTVADPAEAPTSGGDTGAAISTPAAIKRDLEELKQFRAEGTEVMTQVKEELRLKKEGELHRARLRETLEARIKADQERYGPETMEKIEELYQAGAKDWGTPTKAIASFRKLVDTYPESNRAGCCALYLGQLLDSTGRKQEAEVYFRKAAEEHADATYPNGVEVGAYAQFTLGELLAKQGRYREAREEFANLAKNHPHAMDHRGNPLGPRVQLALEKLPR